MATDGDITINKCERCNVTPITPKTRRPLVSIQLNGLGGVWPAQTLQVGDVIEMAFRKNGGAWSLLPKSYEVKIAATEPNTLVAYITLKLEETNFG